MLVGLATATWLQSKRRNDRAVPGPIYLGSICLAHGSVSIVCPGHFPLVPTLAVAISDVALDTADYRLDGQHHPGLISGTCAHLGVPGERFRVG